MRVETIASFLAAQGVGVLAETIFVNFIPDTAPLALMLQSGLIRTPIDYELPGYRRGVFQIIARSPVYDAGYALIGAAITALTIEKGGTEIGNYVINYMRPQHEPVSYPISPGNIIEFSTHFDINYVDVSVDSENAH